MATAASTLTQRTRRFLGDWPELDTTTASIASNGTTLTVADSSIYSQGFLIQLDTEGLLVTATPSGTTCTVRRGVRGTTAASHATSSTVLLRPHFLDIEILDALNSAISACYPWFYQPVVDESLTSDGSATYEYTLPSLNGSPIPAISAVSFKESGDQTFRRFTAWSILRGSTPKLHLRRPLPPGTLRLYGYGPLPTLASLTDTLSTLFPPTAEDALTLYAAQFLLASGEARRVREDTGARDDRESANRVGSSMAASNTLLQRFFQRMQEAQMPPMPKNVQSVI